MTLVNKNRELLVGTSVPPKRLEHVLSILESDPVVHSVHDVKAIMIGMSFPLPRRFLADFPSLFVTRSVGPASARVRDIRLKMFIQPITNHQSITLYPPPRMNSSSIKGYSISAMLLSAPLFWRPPHQRLKTSGMLHCSCSGSDRGRFTEAEIKFDSSEIAVRCMKKVIDRPCND
jgi:hypothetical protein